MKLINKLSNKINDEIGEYGGGKKDNSKSKIFVFVCLLLGISDLQGVCVILEVSGCCKAAGGTEP